jgi:hypothetical protein
LHIILKHTTLKYSSGILDRTRFLPLATVLDSNML